MSSYWHAPWQREEWSNIVNKFRTAVSMKTPLVDRKGSNTAAGLRQQRQAVGERERPDETNDL